MVMILVLVVETMMTMTMPMMRVVVAFIRKMVRIMVAEKTQSRTAVAPTTTATTTIVNVLFSFGEALQTWMWIRGARAFVQVRAAASCGSRRLWVRRGRPKVSLLCGSSPNPFYVAS